MNKFLTQDQFLFLLSEVFTRQYPNERDRLWHVEDLATAVVTLVDTVANTIAALEDLDRANAQLEDIP